MGLAKASSYGVPVVERQMKIPMTAASIEARVLGGYLHSHEAAAALARDVASDSPSTLSVGWI